MSELQISPLWLVVFGFALSVFPIVIALATSYAKVSIVIGILKSALGLQHVPGLLVEGALSLVISFIIMSQVITETKAIALTLPEIKLNTVPSLKVINQYAPLIEPWKKFIIEHTDPAEKHAVIQFSRRDSESLSVLLTAFLLTELKEAFKMAYLLLLPFLAIDLIVGTILAGLGMYMMSPTIVALPLKLLFFIKAGGWILLSKSLVVSY